MLKYGQLLLACVFGGCATIFALNWLAQRNGPLSNSEAPAASIELTPCEVAGPTKDKEKARCGTFEVFEDRDRKIGRKIALKIMVFPATGQDKAPHSHVIGSARLCDKTTI